MCATCRPKMVRTEPVLSTDSNIIHMKGLVMGLNTLKLGEIVTIGDSGQLVTAYPKNADTTLFIIIEDSLIKIR